MKVSYQDRAQDGGIDQSVTLKYTGTGQVAPKVKYTPLDSSGNRVDHVDVTTAYGSDEGRLAVASPGSIDVLAFHGEFASRVVNVEASVVSVELLSGRDTATVDQPVPLIDSEPTEKFERFDQVRVSNENDQDITVRVVCLLYDEPPPGEPQQATDVIVIADASEIAAGSSITIDVSSEFLADAAKRGASCHSLKAHLTP